MKMKKNKIYNKSDKRRTIKQKGVKKDRRIQEY